MLYKPLHVKFKKLKSGLFAPVRVVPYPKSFGLLILSCGQLLVFSVTPFKIDQNKKSKPFNRLSPESGNRKKVDWYAKTLAKIQVTAIFLMEDIRRNVFPKFIKISMEPPCWCPPRWKPAETSVTEFCYKSVNLSLEELRNVTIILCFNTRTVQIAE